MLKFKRYCQQQPGNKLALLLSMGLLLFALPLPAEILLSGNLVQGGLVVGKTTPGDTVLLDDVLLSVSASGNFAFGFGRDDQQTHVLTVIKANQQQESRTLKPKTRDYNMQRIEGIGEKIMKPDPKAVARSQQDNRQINQVRKTKLDISSYSHGFIAPGNGKITGVYGSQRVFNGEPKRPHFGVDFAGKTGDPVIAPAPGKVTLFVPDMFYSGGTLIIDHGQGISSTFLHLSKAYVKVGDEVTQGQLIAAIGSSGRATGPHLDWRLNWFDVRLDPQLALSMKPL